MSTQKMTNEAATRIEQSAAKRGGDMTSSSFPARARHAADENEKNKEKEAPSGMEDVFRTQAQSSQAKSGRETSSGGFPARTQSAATNENAKAPSGFVSRVSAAQQK
ncbi:hypothetical protein E4U19_006780 [Claviceps sp. Clav32 group G5]|nr:hypothetical protein E4U19_006780 [Claviceps sp. Clav32 group G5]